VYSDEDFEFVVQTNEGSRRAVVSKTALRTLGGRSGVTPSEVVKIYHAELSAIIERKLDRREVSDPIRLHGTDLN
jgi:hypothetical protein